MIIIADRLCLYRSSYRAVSSASSAVDASALIDNVRCSLCNSLYWAVTSANSATDAVFSNLECHNITSLVITISTTLSITLGGRVVNNKKTKKYNPTKSVGISDCKDMKVVSFTGKSGTGKSFQATALAQRRGFDAIIDDGLLIYKGQIVAGSSAKKCASKAAAMRTALFNYEAHREEVKDAIANYDPQALMIIGTSDRMTDIVATQLGLPLPEERIYIEDVTTEEQRKLAAHYRIEEGEHVIPAPLGQLRRDFAGYFMDPIKQFIHKARGNAVDADDAQKATEDGPNDRTVVRPTFSYFGSFTISEQVIRDIIKIAAEEYESHLVVVDRMNNGKQTNMSVTIDVMAVRDPESIDKCMDLQQDVYGALVNMTAFTIDSVNVRIRDIVRDREEMLSRKLH